jgi:tetratricopeptide (TPR) repeat protein
MFNHGHKGGSMRAFSAASLTLAAVLALGTISTVFATAGCSQLGVIQARRAAKAANQAYTRQDYQEAAEQYEQAIQADPELGYAYFYLANSLEQQYRPSRKGEPENDAFLTKAVEHYERGFEKLSTAEDEQNKVLARRCLEFLAEVYGADKLNDPGKAEPVIQKLIQMDPSDPGNYFRLARLYEDAGAYAEAEQTYQNAKNAKPKDPTVYLNLAAYYNRQGQFDKTIEALEQRAALEPTNPEAFQTIAGYYWDETQRDVRLNDAQKRAFVQKGLEAANKAINLKGDYVEALTFKGLLLRQQALLEKDPAKQQELIKEGAALGEKANELRKRQTTGVGN